MIHKTSFADYVLVSVAHKELEDKVDLAMVSGYASDDCKNWMLEPQYPEYQLCDFIVSNVAAFLKKEDAEAALELAGYDNKYTMVSHGQREGVEYWYLD